jgi:hypothetical protein
VAAPVVVVVAVVGFPTAGAGAAAGFTEAFVAVAVAVLEAPVAEGATVVPIGILEDEDAVATELLVWDATGENFIVVVVEVKVWFAVGLEAVV